MEAQGALFQQTTHGGHVVALYARGHMWHTLAWRPIHSLPLLFSCVPSCLRVSTNHLLHTQKQRRRRRAPKKRRARSRTQRTRRPWRRGCARRGARGCRRAGRPDRSGAGQRGATTARREARPRARQGAGANERVWRMTTMIWRWVLCLISLVPLSVSLPLSPYIVLGSLSFSQDFAVSTRRRSTRASVRNTRQMKRGGGGGGGGRSSRRVMAMNRARYTEVNSSDDEETGHSEGNSEGEEAGGKQVR